MKFDRLLAISFGLVLTACAGGADPIVSDGGNDNEGGNGGTTAVGGGGMGGSADGGGGGITGPCGMDCSEIQTPDCSVAVCNEGQYQGTIGECVVVNADDGIGCEDGQFCTVNDTCQAGVCVGGGDNDCGMSPGPCESITCDEASQTCGPLAANDGTGCNPTDLCQVNGTCSNGLCVGQPKDCFFAPGITECELGICDPADGVCKPQADPTKDGNACTDLNDLCSDGNTCSGGVCSGGAPKDCTALDIGCQVGVCNAMNGVCEGQAVPAGGTCFDGIGACETGTCDMMGNCVAAPVPNGTMCDDFSVCTINDQCNAGVCGGTVDPNCTTYFQANFETCPPAGWTLTGEWECGAPTTGPAAPYMGAGVLGTDLDSTYENGWGWGTAYADTPPIGLGTATAPVLSYWHYVQTEGFSFDGYNVKVSTDGGMNWTVLTTVTPAYDLTIDGEPAYGGQDQVWEQVLINLSAYVGQQVNLRFDFRSDGSVVFPGVYLDDITVSEGDAIPVNITTASLPDALEGASYSQQITATGGTGNGTWTIQPGGTNDGWLSIDAMGVLSGIPGAGNVGPVTVTIRHEEPTNPTNFDEATYSFNVLSTIFVDDIEAACPGNWTLAGDWQCGAPTSGPNAAFSGTQVLATQLATDYSNSQSFGSATATSGIISLAGTTAPQLQFNVWNETEGSIYDGFNVKISTDGVNFVPVTMTTPAYNVTIGAEMAWGGLTPQWDLYSVDLTTYAGQSIYVRFDFQSDIIVTYPGVYIDDVAIVD